MMNRIAAALLIVLFAASTAHAQLTYGAKGGVTFATVASDVGDNTFRFGLAGGAFVLWPVSSRFAVQPEVLYNQKGAKADSDLVDASFRIDYIEVPILVRYNLSGSAHPFFIFGGPSIAFRVHAQSTAKFGDQTVKDDVTDQVESFEWGLAVGAGKEFSKFFVEGRYTHGMENVDKFGSDSKNRAITAMAGVRF
jgi:hypothetical protein